MGLLDVFYDVARRGDLEYINAALAHGIGLEKAALGTTSPSTPAPLPEGGPIPILGFDGKATGNYAVMSQPVNPSIAYLLNSFYALPVPADTTVLYRAWHDLRAEPLTYCGLEPHEQAHAQCHATKPEAITSTASADGISPTAQPDLRLEA
jgi:hypothetical protein